MEEKPTQANPSQEDKTLTEEEEEEEKKEAPERFDTQRLLT